MDNKKFVGYYIIGAANKEEAKKGAGLILWTQHKPHFVTRLFDTLLLSIHWVDKKDYNPVPKEAITDTKMEFPKHKTYRKKKVDETK
jgi:hypothetical protein